MRTIVFETFDEERGTWVQICEFPRPYTEVTRRFLWWTWMGRDYVSHQDWLIAAVKKAKHIDRANIRPLRVRYLSTIIWHNGSWIIDTADYEWVFGLRDLA